MPQTISDTRDSNIPSPLRARTCRVGVLQLAICLELATLPHSNRRCMSAPNITEVLNDLVPFPPSH
jgi:hypothetical protein